MKNPYEILSVSRTATATDIRAAYRAKVKEVHPDAGGSNSAFSEVVLAYEILSDDYRRKRYDETGNAEDQGKTISSGAIAIVDGLLQTLAQRDDAKYFDVVNLMCADISVALKSKMNSIQVLEKRVQAVADLKDRFKSNSGGDNILHDILDRKIELLTSSIDADRLSIAQLKEASAIVGRYEFVRESREKDRESFVDLSAFGRPVDPLLKTDEINLKKPND